jgi:hypothetical protein
METPYGEVPDSFVRDMRPQEMHDFLRKRYGRRTVLKAGAIGAAAAAVGPLFWKQSSAFAAGPFAPPQWISYGADPTSDMWVNWSAGSYNTAGVAPSPQVRWGLSSAYGNIATATGLTVPVPASPPYSLASGDVDDTLYLNTELTGLSPDTTYHYSVSNDGLTWGPDTTFTTGQSDPTSPWTFAVTGDEATNTLTTSPIAQMIANLAPAFTIIAGDLSYASSGVVLPAGGGAQPAYSPSAWDAYFSCISPTAQSVPWLPGVGNHEMEPLTDDGYAGFVTRFPQPYDPTSGSPVVRSFRWGNVAFLQLDGNDLSAEISPNNGYTGGTQTTWLTNELATYRATGSGIDFIVVSFHNCMFCSNQTHGSDSGIRNVWQPIFDQYNVDVVFNGHVHAYERAHPIKGTTLTPAPSGSTIEPATVGTTYICAGGGGQSLYTTWYGTTTAGDSGAAALAKTNQWSGGDSATGGVGTAQDITDPWLASAGVSSYSANRKGNWTALSVTVTPASEGGTTTLLIEALDPTQTGGGITSVASPAVIDTITLSRTAGPPAVTPEVGSTDLLVVAGGAVLGAGAYAMHRRHASREQIVLPAGQRLN